MYFQNLAVVLLLPLYTFALGEGLTAGLKAVKEAFDEANIPRDLTIQFKPTVLLDITLPQATGASITLKPGIQLPRNSTAGPPIFSITGSAGKGPFVIAAVDPDAPSPDNPIHAQVLHLVAGDFDRAPSNGHLGGSHLLRNSTPAFWEYRQPAPVAGLHRYIFLLFHQSAGFDNQTLVNANTPIILWNVSVFANAVGLGDPIGGNFMRVVHED